MAYNGHQLIKAVTRKTIAATIKTTPKIPIMVWVTKSTIKVIARRILMMRSGLLKFFFMLKIFSFLNDSWSEGTGHVLAKELM
jgi:hypothetical protein